MMKRVILAAVALLVLGICGVGALLAAGYQGNHKLQMPIFAAIADEDVDAFLTLCDPRLRDEIDPPVLKSWMAAMNDSLGQCRFEPVSSFSFKIEKQANGTVVKSSGGMQFENGNATSELVFLNSKLVEFQIDTDRLTGDWFNGPSETSVYEHRGEVVIRTLLERRLEDLKPMLHPALIEAAPDAKLLEICDLGDEWAGKVFSIAQRGTEFQRGESQELIVRMKVTGDRGVMDATVTVTFVGLKGHVTAFNIQPAN